MVYINWSDIALFQRLEGWENVRVTGETTPLRVVIVRDHVCVCGGGGGGGMQTTRSVTEVPRCYLERGEG